MAVKIGQQKKPSGWDGTIFGIPTVFTPRVQRTVGDLANFAGHAAANLYSGVPSQLMQSGLSGFQNFFNQKGPAPKKAAPKQATPKSTPDNSDPGTTFSYLDALKQAQDYLGQNGGGSSFIDYSPLINQTRQTYGDASNRLLAMYQALHNNFQNDAGSIGSIFDQAKNADTQAANTATGEINQAYNNARQAQTDQFNALGSGGR